MTHGADEQWMRRAIELARRAEGRTRPNPLVGAVLVTAEGKFLAEGYHQLAGEPHAEVEALAAARRTGMPTEGATIYVTLEPCNHQGRTGPCSVALLEAGIARAVVAVRDPNREARGGIERLRAAGVEVETGVLREEAALLNPGFMTRHLLGRPFVTLKWAMTLDGCTSVASGDSKWITGEAARAQVHRRRALHDVVLAGIGTVLTDDARLTARHGEPPAGPPRHRAVLDSSLRLPPDALFLGDAEDGSLPLVFCTQPAAGSANAEALRGAGAEVVPVEAAPDGRLAIAGVLAALADRGAQSVYVEGGRTVAGSFLEAGLADRVEAWIAPSIAGGGAPHLGPVRLPAAFPSMADALRLHRPSFSAVGGDWLCEGWLTDHLFHLT